MYVFLSLITASHTSIALILLSNFWKVVLLLLLPSKLFKFFRQILLEKNALYFVVASTMLWLNFEQGFRFSSFV